MSTSAKTLAALGLAFVAGITAKSVLMPDSPSPVSETLPKVTASATAAPTVRNDPKPGTWSDPVRSSDTATRPTSRQAPEAKLAFTPEPAPPIEAKQAEPPPDATVTPRPPARPAGLTATAGEIADRKAADPSRAVSRAHASPPRALASLPPAKTTRNGANQRQAARAAERRRDRQDYDTGYRQARFPDRSYAYVEDDGYGPEGDPDLGRGIWRRQAGPRVIARRGGGPDGLMDWLSQPGHGY